MSQLQPAIRDVKHVTNCLICGEVMRDPICFPCKHWYCLGCIETKEGRKQFGDVIQCLLCKKAVAVPEGGLEKLPNDSFIDKLIKNVESQEEEKKDRMCSVCCEDVEKDSEVGSGISEAAPATVFCKNCQEFMCDKCSSLHRNMKLSKLHDFESIENVDISQEHCDQISYCAEHPNGELNLYCIDCESLACLLCLTADHQKHNVSAVSAVVENLKEQMQRGIRNVCALKKRNTKTHEALETQTKIFLENVETAKIEIEQRCEELRRMVDSLHKEMLGNIECEKLNKSQEIENRKIEITTENTIFDYYVKYTETLLNEGHSTDIARNTKDLKKLAGELNTNPKAIDEFRVIFQRNMDIENTNIIGAISITPLKPISYERLPKLNNTMSHNNYVQAVTAFGNELFVGFSRSSEIKVYNIGTLDFQRRIHVPGLDDPWDMAATKNLLFVSETDHKMVHKVELPEERTTSWSVQSRWLGLSIRTAEKSLLVTCNESNTVKEFTFNGKLSREFDTEDWKGMKCPHHAIELVTDSTLCVCHGGDPHGVSRIKVKGESANRTWNNAKKSLLGSAFTHRVLSQHTLVRPQMALEEGGLKCETKPGSISRCRTDDIDPKGRSFNSPSHLACDKRGNVMVADCSNNRVVLLNSKLEYIKEIIPSSEGLKSSFKICLDEFHRKFFVADSLNKRLLAYDIF